MSDVTWALPHTLTAKKYAEASNAIAPCLSELVPTFQGTSTVADALDVLTARMVPAFDQFLASCDHVDAFVDQKISSGEWQTNKLLEGLRDERDKYRRCRDELVALAVRAREGSLTRDEVAVAVMQALAQTMSGSDE